jgi:hypothetical protein
MTIGPSFMPAYKLSAEKREAIAEFLATLD